MDAADIHIRSLDPDDYPDVARIYRQGMDTGMATFETSVPDWMSWNAKFLMECRFVLADQTDLLGWCALSRVSAREVYKGVAETTIYMAPEARGQGMGKLLLQHLVEASEAAGYWTLQAGIFPQNTASLKMHKDCGFRTIGYRERVAQRQGVWYDNILMERRSKKL